MASININNWRLKNARIFVTLEPCLMCLSAIILSKIKRIYYCLQNKKFHKCNLEIKKKYFNNIIFEQISIFKKQYLNKLNFFLKK